MAEALGRWLRDEMELPPSASPSPAALRRLCSGPSAPIWDFVSRHVRSQRTVQKIRGNLRWYRHLQELEAAAGPPSRQGALRGAIERLRKELRDLGDAIEGAQETAQRLEASLGAGQSRRWAELRRGAELRLLGAGPSPEQLRGHQGALKGPQGHRPGQSRAELSAILASGAEPEVLVSIKALCKAREAELQRPRPPRKPQEEPTQAPDWLQQAEAVLIGYSPEAVLWALEALANQSTRELLAGPAPSPEAPPTLRSLIQERWGAVGAVWGALPPLLSRLSHLRGLLGALEPQLRQEPQYRLLLSRAFLASFLSSLRRESPKTPKPPEFTPKSAPKSTLKSSEFTPKLAPKSTPKSSEFTPKLAPKSAPKSPEFAPKSAPKLAPKSPEFAPKLAPKSAPKSWEFAPKSPRGRLQRRLQRGRGRALRAQQRLRFLSAATRGRRAGLRPLQEQVLGVARAGPGSAPPSLLGAGQRRRGLVLGALGALGQPLPHPGAPPPPRGLGGAKGALLSRAAILKQQLRQGALWLRRGAGPALGAGPELVPPLPPPEGVAELLPRLQLVSASCRQRIRAWPRLQGLVSQWWAQPAQWALATPPGHTPFSHWLQRWRNAAHALQATPTPEMATPTLALATPTEEEEEKATPP